MNRREFMMAASGVSGAAVAATAGTTVTAQEDDEPDDETAEDGDTDEDGEPENGDPDTDDPENGDEENGVADGEDEPGPTETIEVGDNFFEPDSLTIEPGTTVEWEWVGTVDHNVNPTDQPDDADWDGHPELQSSGTYEHTFDVEGEYAYTCDPHPGMDGTITVTEDADEAAVGEVDIHDIGVPIQKHYVGIATMLAIFLSLVFTFYLLKYGESPHSSSPGRR